jgi:hypothetical protein
MPRVRDPVQLAADPLTDLRADVRAVDGKLEVGQRDETPVEAEPLAIRVDLWLGEVEQAGDDRPVGNRLAVGSNPGPSRADRGARCAFGTAIRETAGAMVGKPGWMNPDEVAAWVDGLRSEETE